MHNLSNTLSSVNYIIINQRGLKPWDKLRVFQSWLEEKQVTGINKTFRRGWGYCPDGGGVCTCEPKGVHTHG